MATKGPRRQGVKFFGLGKKTEEMKKKRGTGKSSRMDEIMGGLSSGRKKKPAKKGK